MQTPTKPRSTYQRPSQDRSKATFAAILDAATEIVVARGIQGLNTNLVAERAGVNIGTVYHYFPDKTAILVELFRLDQRQRSHYLLATLRQLPTTPDLAVWVRTLFELVRQLRSEHPTTTPMRRAFRSVPELVALDSVDTSANTTLFAGLLCERYAGLDDERAHFASRLLVETTMTIMDSELADGPEASAFFDEALHLITTYLADLER